MTNTPASVHASVVIAVLPPPPHSSGVASVCAHVQRAAPPRWVCRPSTPTAVQLCMWSAARAAVVPVVWRRCSRRAGQLWMVMRRCTVSPTASMWPVRGAGSSVCRMELLLCGVAPLGMPLNPPTPCATQCESLIEGSLPAAASPWTAIGLIASPSTTIAVSVGGRGLEMLQAGFGPRQLS